VGSPYIVSLIRAAFIRVVSIKNASYLIKLGPLHDLSNKKPQFGEVLLTELVVKFDVVMPAFFNRPKLI
jgi:hypothetical protein